MQSNTPPFLSVYRASAGSGKTYRLVSEYMKMLFEKGTKYRHILAVTFTNKATAELKERILRELSQMAEGKPSPYLAGLSEFGDENLIRERAGELLHTILHDYSRFSVVTIDSFFQGIIRSFARELNLPGTFRTEIDDSRMMEEAVERLFMEIDTNDQVRDWLIHFIEKRLDEGKNWDIKPDLFEKGKLIYKEEFKEHSEAFVGQLADKKLLEEYRATLYRMKSVAENKLKSTGDKGMALIAQSGLTPADFKGGGRGFVMIFKKLQQGDFSAPTATVLKSVDTVEEWYSKKTDSDTISRIVDIYHKGLNDLLKEACRLLGEEVYLINSADAILINFYPFGLLSNIALLMQKLIEEKQSVLLSESGRLISKIIEENDSPFIYEKVGMTYNHFMLDEFQDTSRQQWNNFKPLLINSLAAGNSSFIVGDVKQSIYRWRNGDWNLLATEVSNSFRTQGVNNITLTKNWRSTSSVVRFNNTLFGTAPAILESQFQDKMTDSIVKQSRVDAMRGVLTHAYDDHYQEISGQSALPGYVNISFFVVEKDSDKFNEQALDRLTSEIEKLQLEGVAPHDITILVAEHREAALIVDALLTRKSTNPAAGCVYDVVSANSLNVGYSPAVKFVIRLVQLISGHNRDLMKAELLYLWHNLILPQTDPGYQPDTDRLHDLFTGKDDREESARFEPWFDDAPDNPFIGEMLSLPLYSLITKMIVDFNLHRLPGEWSFLHAFLDLVLDFSQQESAGLPAFLEWWEQDGESSKVTIEETKGFIRVTTIHQSKGLEFKVVLVPFCNWSLLPSIQHAPEMWCSPEVEPFSQLSLVLVNYHSRLANSIFAPEYYREMLYTYVDKLNLLYVALTRAVEALIIFAPYKLNGPDQATTAGQLLQMAIEGGGSDALPGREGYTRLKDHWDESTLQFSMGERLFSPQKQGREESFIPSPWSLQSDSSHLRLRSGSQPFPGKVSSRSQKQKYGLLLHALFEKIRTIDDLPWVMNKLLSDSEIDEEDARYLNGYIPGLLAQEPFSEWFSNRWKVLNERMIVGGDRGVRRPDRVMIDGNRVLVVDYKTGEKKDADLYQVRGYLNDVRQMGYTDVRGFIWYITENEVINV